MIYPASLYTRILVTGSRTWTDREFICREMEKAALFYPLPAVLIHGDCPEGADSLAKWLAINYLGWAHEPHPTDWTKYGRRAGFIRNAEMVQLGATHCLAFLRPCVKRNCQTPMPHWSHGADHCAWLALKAGIPTTRFEVP